MSLHGDLLLKGMRSKLMLTYVSILLGLSILTARSFMKSYSLFENTHAVPLEIIKIYMNIANSNEFLFIYIPLYLLFILQALTVLYHENIFLKYNNPSKWLSHLCTLIFYFAILFTAIIQGFLFLLLFFRGIAVSYLFAYVSFFIVTSVLQTAGYVVIGLLCVLTVIMLRQSYWGLLIPCLLLISLQICKTLFKAEWPTFVDYMSSNHKINLGILTTNISDIFIIICFLIVICLLFILIKLLLKDKDFYGG